MQIRAATEDDLSAIVAIFNAAIPQRLATAIVEPISTEDRREWFRQHSSDRYPLWVAELDGRVVGWLALSQFFPDRPAYAHTAELSVYLAGEVQRRGYGQQLTEYALDAAARLGIKNVVSLVFSHNRASLRLHEKLGFERWGMMPQVAELDAVPRDVVILGKRLARRD